jgi:Rad3-related DNA helicase
MSEFIVPERPSDLSLTVPGNEWREHQREAVAAVLDGLSEGAKVMLSAPTGSGKTVIGSSLARIMGGRAMFLSHTIHLQRQQLRTLPEARTATGRRNHPCLLPDPFERELSSEDAPCPCPHATPDGCDYYRQWFECADAREVVLNYAYAVRVSQARGIKTGLYDMNGKPVRLPNPFIGRDILVCDEGHFVERALIDADTVDIYPRSLQRLGLEDIPEVAGVEAWTPFARDNVEHLEDWVKDLHATMRASRDAPAPDFVKQVRRVRAALVAVNGILTAASNFDKVPQLMVPAPYGYQLKPLWAWHTAHQLLFRHSQRAVIMSATLGDPALLARLLGIPQSEWRYVEVPSTFPVENRPVFYWPLVRMNRNTTAFDKVKQAQALIYLAKKWPNSPGVVHCASYPLGEFIIDCVQKLDSEVASRLLWHKTADRDATFTDFETNPGTRILVTPSAMTGVDWDFVAWQMIPKVPFGDLGDIFTRMRYDYVAPDDVPGEAPLGRRVYQQEAALNIVQASGRCVRTPTSKGVTVITDTAFLPLFKYTSKDSFPGWFRDAVRWYTPTL